MMTNNTLTAVPGIRVGHVTDIDAATGCTVIICPPNTVGGVDVRGGAPGTRETNLLMPIHQVQHVNAIMLAGGSAYGLAAADGAMRYLEQHRLGYVTRTNYIVPIVASAIVFDLAVGRYDLRPDAAMGYQACENAVSSPVEQGSVGAATGCRIGAMYGNEFATKGGLGSASMDLGNGLIVAALAVVNAVGDVIDENGAILAGLRQPPDGKTFVGVLNAMREFHLRGKAIKPPVAQATNQGGENTVIGVVATTAKLDREGACKIAQMAHDGLARAVNPAHTMYDGDAVFALATGNVESDVSFVGAMGAEVFAQAVRSGVRAAKGLAGIRAWNE